MMIRPNQGSHKMSVTLQIQSSFAPTSLDYRHTQEEGTTVGAQSHLRAAAEVKLVRKKGCSIAKLCHAHGPREKMPYHFWDQGNNSSTGALSLHIRHLIFVSVSPTRPLAP